MFKTIIGHSIKNNNDYRIFLTNKSHDKFSTINFSYGTDESSIKEFELEKDNEKFVQNAKPEVLAIEQKKKADALARIQTIEESLAQL